jgi:hypothetical protein
MAWGGQRGASPAPLTPGRRAVNRRSRPVDQSGNAVFQPISETTFIANVKSFILKNFLIPKEHINGAL